MSDDTPIQPSLDDVRNVLSLAFMLLRDSDGLDLLLGALQTAAGVTPVSDVPAPPAWAAANQFVLDTVVEGVALGLRYELDDH